MAASVSTIRLIINYALSRGVSRQDLFGQISLTPEVLEDPDAEIPSDTFFRLWEILPVLCHDPYFGLHFGMDFEPPRSGGLAYLLHSCATVREAFSFYSRYYRILGDFFELEIQEEADRFRLMMSQLTWEKRSPLSAMHGYEGRFAIIIRLINSLTGKAIFPRTLWLSRPTPAVKADFVNIFGANIQFGQSFNAIEFDQQVLALPVISADRNLKEALEKHLQMQLRQLENSRSMSDRLSYYLLSSDPGQFPNLETSARHFHLSVRSLQRKLQEEQQNYQSVLEKIRLDLAKNYLDQGLPITEVALLLGYADLFSFSHFFKKQMGLSPSQYKVKNDS